MRRLLRVLFFVLLAAIAGVVAVGIAARLSDGPLGPFPGGPLRAGELAPWPDDWSAVTDVQEVEVQLLRPPRSRITWILVHEGVAYIPCGFLRTPLFKRWPHEALEDGRAVVRIQGRRYEGRLVRSDDADLRAKLDALAAAKYNLPASGPSDPADVWYFRFEPPAPG
jgi:hypothetical protein